MSGLKQLCFGVLLAALLLSNRPAMAQTTAVLSQTARVPATETFTVTPTPADNFSDQLFKAINQLRIDRQLSTLILDERLTEAAMDQANYMMSINQLTERGPKKESAAKLAEAAGYAAGAPFVIDQAIASSWLDTSAKYIVESIWFVNPQDRAALINEDMVHIGIGVVADRSKRFIVVYIAALEDQSIFYTPFPTLDPSLPTAALTATATDKPMTLSTAAADGSQTHTIQKGETLSDIAYAYHVDWYTIAQLNNLDLEDPVIIEGDTLLIRPKFTPTMTPTITETPRPPTRTPRPTYTADPRQGVAVTTPIAATPTALPQAELDLRGLLLKAQPYRELIAFLLILISSLGLIASLFLKKSKK